MKEIEAREITQKVKEMCIEANYILGKEVLTALKEAKEKEESPLGKEILEELIENARIAREEGFPLCQDTGSAVFFVEMGEGIRIKGGNLTEAINQGVREGYQEGYLRKSLCHPFTRKNTGNNTPATIHLELAPGENLKIVFLAKGGGAENMSGIKMLSPSGGIPGIKEFVINQVKEAGSNPCPPIVVGVGIGGGSFEQTALLAKKALTRPLNSPNPDKELASLERELLEGINNLGIGPQGMGGRITALAVHIEMLPCHIASFPVAVNINCHSLRHKEIIL